MSVYCRILSNLGVPVEKIVFFRILTLRIRVPSIKCITRSCWSVGRFSLLVFFDGLIRRLRRATVHHKADGIGGRDPVRIKRQIMAGHSCKGIGVLQSRI